MVETAFIYEAVRTPRGKGKHTGSLHEVKPVFLLSGLLRNLQARHGFDTSLIDDVLIGCVSPIGEQGGDIAKTAAQVAGWSDSVPGVQLDRFCASGLEAVNLAAMKIASGWEDLVVAGGVESMSRVTMGAAGGASLIDPEISMLVNTVPQGISADLLATVDGYTREDLDRYAVLSQRRSAHARENGHFDGSVIPVCDVNGVTILQRDEFLKPETTMEGLARLKPVFESLGALGYDELALRKYVDVERINHVHTAGNSSGIVDGASAVLIGNGRIGKTIGIAPRARIVATAVLATESIIMLTGPGPAARKCLAKAGMSVADIDLFEINEAYASVVLRFMRDLGISEDVTNVNGGAISLGHPLGATGAMLVGTVLDELERRGLSRALIALCVGGGMGIATIIERV
jgi:acetyl-CoA C-acetyltransferase